MSHSRGKLHRAEFCPWCGSKQIDRDDFGESKTSGQCSYLCTSCGAGFALRDSPRVHFAHQLFQRDRSVRPQDDEHKTFVQCKPLTERSLFELRRVEGILLSKSPHSATSAAENARNLAAVQAEINKRRKLTYKIGEVIQLHKRVEAQ